jgi:hypothetical protein
MKKRVGRPKKPKAESRAPGISVRLTIDESKTIGDAVADSGLRQSDWARKALLYVAQRDIRIT